MAGSVFVPPDGAGARYNTPSVEMERIHGKCVEIWNTIQEIKQHSPKAEHLAALDFFGRVRALSAVVGVLAEQPGYRPDTQEWKDARQSMAPLKAKMDEIITKLNTTVDMTNPLPYTAPKRVRWMENQADKLKTILLDPANAKDIRTISEDKNLSWETKAVFFDWVGNHINNAMMEVVKSKKHEEDIFAAVTKTLDSHENQTIIGACLWFGQTAASSAGNLPGPNSLYVGLIHVHALRGFSKGLKTRGPTNVLGDILPHWYDALKLSADERTNFDNALGEFKEQHQIAANPSSTQAAKDLAGARADQIYADKIKTILKKGGSPQSGPALTVGMTIVNIICVYFVWESTPSLAEMSLKNVGDMVSASLLALAGVGSSTVRLLAEIKVNIQWMTKLVESPFVGAGLGYFTGFMSILDGLDVIREARSKTKTDWWMVGSGVLQISSGVAIIFGVLFATPGLQLAGVVLGFAAGAIAVVVDLTKEPMVQFINELLDKIKAAPCEWDRDTPAQTLIIDNVGLRSLVSEFEGLVTSCGVVRLGYQASWTEHGVPVAKGKATDALVKIGIADADQRVKLLRMV